MNFNPCSPATTPGRAERKVVFKPIKEFHTARHTLYSAEENMEIDKVVPVAASVKTKLGRGGTGEE